MSSAAQASIWHSNGPCVKRSSPDWRSDTGPGSRPRRRRRTRWRSAWRSSGRWTDSRASGADFVARIKPAGQNGYRRRSRPRSRGSSARTAAQASAKPSTVSQTRGASVLSLLRGPSRVLSQGGRGSRRCALAARRRPPPGREPDSRPRAGPPDGAPLGADLLILAGPSPAPQLRLAFESATAGDEAPEAQGVAFPELTALPSLGITVKGASHAILR